MHGTEGADGSAAAELAARTADVLRELLEVSHHMLPNDLPDAVRTAVVRAGFLDGVIRLVDHEQRVLVALGRDEPALPIDPTLAGRAFQSEEPAVTETDDGDGYRLWLPLRDGIERLGVLMLVARHCSEAVVDGAEHIATLIAEIIVSKRQYGDGLVVAKRRQAMSLAAEFRWALLPPLSFRSGAVSIACYLEPTYLVAGDAFDYSVNDNTVHIAIFDAVGHELEAARIANLAIAAYRHRRRLGVDLEDTYLAIDEALRDQFGAERFCTGQLGQLDCESGRVRWVNAGHPVPILLRQKRIALQVEGRPDLPMGLAAGAPTIHELSLEPGDSLIFFSDGVVEARSSTGDPFGEERLVEFVVRAAADQMSTSETVRRLMHAVLAHQEGEPLRDDATILLVEWHGGG